MSKIKNLGSFISKMQKTGIKIKVDTGLAILPAMSLVKIGAVFCFDQKNTKTFNVLIRDKKVADHYGVFLNTALSIPIEITKDKIVQITDIPVLDSKKVKLREAQIEMNKEMQLF